MIKRASTSEAALIPVVTRTQVSPTSFNLASAAQVTVHVAFDLHRADLLTALRMTPPGRQDAERTLNEQWCDHWRQGIPMPATLHYTTARNDSHPL